MGAFVKGEVVVVDFPFSDLSQTKRRPALVIANLAGDDMVLCQITGQAKRNRYAVPLDDGDFVQGNLRGGSYIRAERLFTAANDIVHYSVGYIADPKIGEVVKMLTAILHQ